MTILSLELAARYGAYPVLLGRNILYLVKENLASCCVKSQSNTEKWKFDFIITKEITRFARTPWVLSRVMRKFNESGRNPLL